MRWGVLWDFRKDGTERWLDDFVPEGSNTFTKISTGYGEISWHTRRSGRSKFSRWTSNGLIRLYSSNVDGVITVFPPLAAMVGLKNRVFRSRQRHVAWAFNIGHHPAGWRRKVIQFALAKIDRIVVHSHAEVKTLQELFELADGQVEFVHLQGPDRPTLATEDLDQPFVVAIGSANRDYDTLLAALERTGFRAKIVASPRVLDQIKVPDNVELIAGASWEECLRLAQQARICVTPLKDPTVATGQVTIVDHLTMGRPIVATSSIGTVDYIKHGITGMLTPPGDVGALVETLQMLWVDPSLRTRLGRAGQQFAAEFLSDPTIGMRLGDLLKRVEAEARR